MQGLKLVMLEKGANKNIRYRFISEWCKIISYVSKEMLLTEIEKVEAPTCESVLWMILHYLDDLEEVIYQLNRKEQKARKEARDKELYFNQKCGDLEKKAA